MTLTITQIMNELSQLRDSVRRKNDDTERQLQTVQSHIEQLKKEPTSCPLEEGKEVKVIGFRSRVAQAFSERAYCYVSVQPPKDTTYGADIIIRIPWGDRKDVALAEAMQITLVED